MRDARNLEIEVIVVDSGSHDGSPEMVRRDFPKVNLVEQSHNVGFARGNNIGLEKATGGYLMLLNPDTEIVAGALMELVGFLDQNPTVGVVGPQLLNSDGSIQSSRRRFPTMVTALFESTWLQPLAPKSVLEHYFAFDLPDSEPASVDWLQGAAIITRQDVVNRVGILDEHFFMYSEELDWQRRIKDSGFDVVYLPYAKVIHHGGKSSDQVLAERHIYFNSSKVWYFTKHHGRFAGLLLRFYLLLGYVSQLLIEWTKGLLGNKRTLRKERVMAYWKVLCSGLRISQSIGRL